MVLCYWANLQRHCLLIRNGSKSLQPLFEYGHACNSLCVELVMFRGNGDTLCERFQVLCLYGSTLTTILLGSVVIKAEERA